MPRTVRPADLPQWSVALQLALDAQGLSQGAFERAAGLSHGASTKWLQGKTSPDMESLGRIQRTLGIDLTNEAEVAAFISQHQRANGTDG